MAIDIIVKGLTGRLISLTNLDENVVTMNGLRALVRAVEDESASLTDAMYGNISLESDPNVNLTNDGAKTLSVAGISDGDRLISTPADDPSTLTKEQRQLQKLEIAAAKREFKGYTNFTYDVNLLPNPYNGDDIDPDDGDAGPLDQGRPWT